MMKPCLKILIVDDNHALTILLGRYLKRMAMWNVEYSISKSPKEAVAKNREFAPDVAIIGYMLGNETGIDLILKLKRTGLRTSFLLLTEVGGEKEAVEDLRAGGSDYLSKAELSPETLERSLLHVIERKKADEALQYKTQLIKLLQDIAITANEALTVDEAMQNCLDKVCSYTGWPIGHVYLPDSKGKLFPSNLWHFENPQRFEAFRKVTEATPFESGVGLPGRVLVHGKPFWITDVNKEPWFLRSKLAKNIGVKAGFAFPVLEGQKVVAVLEFFSEEAKEPDESLLETISNLATQLGRVTERKRVEEKLRLQAQVLKNMAEGVLLTRASDGIIVFTNHRYEEMFSYGPNEMIGKHVSFLNAPLAKNSEEAANEIRKSLDETGMWSGEVKNVKKDGTIFWCKANISTFEHASYGTVRVTVHEDITERKQAEIELRKSEEKFSQLVENINEIFWLENLEGTEMLYVSPAYELLRKRTCQSLYDNPKSWMDAIHPEDRQHVIDAFLHGRVNGTYSEEFRIILPDGSLQWVRDRCFPIRDASGKIYRIAGIAQDITKRKKAERELKESEKRFRMFSDASMEGIAITEKGIILETNKRLAKMVCYDQKELLGKKATEIVLQKHRKDVMEKMLSDYDKPYKTMFMRKDGTIFPVEVCGKPIMFHGRKARISSIRNLSERKQAEEALRKALTEVKQLKNRLQEENIYLRDEIKVEHQFGSIIGLSDSLKKVLRKVEQVAATDSNVLILGETGTGKELIARSIHEMSLRQDRPLVKLNCVTLPANLIESELFGHTKGAFTGALLHRIGRFELAHRGTIFLDEIGDMPLELQVKLLRVLQDGELELLGCHKTIKVDVRVIAATNRDLEKQVQKGAFRKDLFYRLNVFPIYLPPLRDRREDIPLLAKHYIKRHNAKLGKHIDVIPTKVMNVLQTYHWPGNVRELENIIERAMVIGRGSKLELGDWFPGQKGGTAESGPPRTLREAEKQLILNMLDRTMWRVSGRGGAAEILGIKPTTLESKIKKLGINRPK